MAEIHIVFILAVNGHAIQDRHFNFNLIRRFKAIRHFDLLIALNRVLVDHLGTAVQNHQRLAVHRRAVAHAHGFEGDVSFRMRGEIRHDFLIHIVVVEGVMPDELAFLRVVPLLKAGRHSVAGDEAGLAIAGQRVGIIQLVAVEIRLIERQVEAAVVQTRHQLVIDGLWRFRRGLLRCLRCLRIVVCCRSIFQLFQPSDALLVLLVVHRLSEHAEVRGQRRTADNKSQYDSKYQCGRNLFLHDFFFLSNCPKHRLTAFERKLAIGKACFQRVPQLFFIHQNHTFPVSF